ncbi:ATP-binding cassette domain-containing protein [Streptomyces xylophagus]|uniref:ATP-binding cassette domain-containing protein n=1 Tax=Streptomyces xylophagus TaxID=285514 RepID=UPI000ADBB600|nr:ABC transporter ATP-binding protein [Streptomyces xylophagus]
MSGTDPLATLTFGHGTTAVVAVHGTDLSIRSADRPTDEPTGELDGTTQQLVLRTVRQRAADGCAVLIVTRSTEAVRTADRAITPTDQQAQQTPEMNDVPH